MAPGRLTFLYPHLLRAVRAGAVPRTPRALGLARRNSTFARRSGSAVEPVPLQGEQAKSFTMPAAGEDAADIEGPEDDTHIYESEPAAEENDAIELPPVSEIPSEDAQPKEEEILDEERSKQAKEEAKLSGPLEAVLHMQAPETVAREHPAMTPPPYIHHFDTYSLVKELQNGGYSQAQATTAMKGIRTMLAQNLDVAQSTLVSKSDVENVSFTSCVGWGIHMADICVGDVSLHGSLLRAEHRDQEQQAISGRGTETAADAPTAPGGCLDAVAESGAADVE